METEQIVNRPEETTTKHKLEYMHNKNIDFHHVEENFVELQNGCGTRTIDVGASRVYLLC
jgi:hypothetical protein